MKLKKSADANFEDPLTTPLNPSLMDDRHYKPTTHCGSRRLVKTDVITLVDI